MAPTEPTAFDATPAYITDGIDRQDTETLAAIEEYAHARREYPEALEARDLGARSSWLTPTGNWSMVKTAKWNGRHQEDALWKGL